MCLSPAQLPAANHGNRSSVSSCAVRALLTKNVELSAPRKAINSLVDDCTTLGVRVEEYEAAVRLRRDARKVGETLKSSEHNSLSLYLSAYHLTAYRGPCMHGLSDCTVSVDS